MATFVNPIERHAYKNMMIEAQLFGSQVVDRKKKLHEKETG